MLMWLKVKLDNGKIGYVFGSHLQIESPEKIDFSQPMTQNGKTVQPTKNLSPSTNANTSNTSNNELKIKVGTITGSKIWTMDCFSYNFLFVWMEISIRVVCRRNHYNYNNASA